MPELGTYGSMRGEAHKSLLYRDQISGMKTRVSRPPPCPLCEKLSWRFFRDPGTHATQVVCCRCGARGPLCIPSEEEALAAWSERVS